MHDDDFDDENHHGSTERLCNNNSVAPRARQLRVFAERKNRTNDFLRQLRATKKPAALSSPNSTRKKEEENREKKFTSKWSSKAKAKVDTRRRREKKRELDESKEKKKKKKSVVENVVVVDHAVEKEVEKKIEEEKNATTMSLDDDDDDDEREPLVTRRAKEAVNMLKSNPVSPRENVERYYECIELLRERRKRAARDAFQKAKSKREERRKRKEEEKAARMAALTTAADGDCGDEGCKDEESAESSDSDEGEEDEETRKKIFEKELQYEFKTTWKDIAHESKDMMNKETQRDAIKSLELELRRAYISARLIFKHYALLTKPFDENIGAAELGSMTLNDWFAFLKDCDLIGANSVDENNKKMLKSSAELLFIRLNWITDASGRKVKNADTTTNSDRSLVITEFCVGILRLAKALRP